MAKKTARPARPRRSRSTARRRRPVEDRVSPIVVAQAAASQLLADQAQAHTIDIVEYANDDVEVFVDGAKQDELYDLTSTDVTLLLQVLTKTAPVLNPKTTITRIDLTRLTR